MRGGRNLDSLVPRNKYLLAIALAALVVGLLQAADLVQFPFGVWFSWLTGSALSAPSLNEFMTRYGYASLFALMALESASLPIPSEVVLPLAGYFVRIGVLPNVGVLPSFWVAVGVSTFASLVGALADYFLAAWLGRPFVVRLLDVFKLHRGALDRAEAWFDRSAQWTVFAARFVPGLRTIISLPAGLFEMGVVRFVLMTTAGCLAWSVVLIYAGFLAGSASGSAFTTSPTVIDGLSALVAATAAAYIGYYAYSALRSPRERPTLSSSVS